MNNETPPVCMASTADYLREQLLALGSKSLHVGLAPPAYRLAQEQGQDEIDRKNAAWCLADKGNCAGNAQSKR